MLTAASRCPRWVRTCTHALSVAVLMSLAALSCSHALHESLAMRLFRLPYTFFLDTPPARILNRFAKVGVGVGVGGRASVG